MIIRAPTRTKTKSFRGDQVDFRFPMDTNEDNSPDETQLNNHFLVNKSLKSEDEHSDTDQHSDRSSYNNDDPKNLMSPLISNNTMPSTSSMKKAMNLDCSNGYYSFANISDNTTSPSFFHERYSSGSNEDVISLLHINGKVNLENSNLIRSEYPYTLAPQKNTDVLPSEHVPSSSSKNVSVQTVGKPINEVNTIPTADNLSYDIISSESLSRLNSAKLDSLRLPSSSSSSNISLQGSLMRGSATVKRTPMNLYRKPTMRKVESTVFSTDDNSSKVSCTSVSENKFRNNNNNNKQTSRLSQNRKSSISPNTKKLDKWSSQSKQSDSRVIGRMNSSRRNSKSSLKRSNAIRCHGGLLKFFESLGIKIRNMVKQIKLLLFRKRTNKYQSKNYNNRPITSSGSSLNKNILKNRNQKVGSTHVPLANEKKKLKVTSSKKSNHIPNASSLQALQPAIIEKTNIPNTSILNKKFTENGNIVNNSNEDLKLEINKMVSPIIGMEHSSTTPSASKISSTRTNSTLRRTNSSIRRAASILTSSTPSTTTYYSTVTHQENSNSPIRRSRLIKSNASTSLSSLVRQPSIVVKNKVIPLSLSQFIPGDASTYTSESPLGNGYGDIFNKNSNQKNTPSNSEPNLDTFATIKEEDEDSTVEEQLNMPNVNQDIDSGSSIFTQLDTHQHSIQSSRLDSSKGCEKEGINNTDWMLKEELSNYSDRKEATQRFLNIYLSQIIRKRILMRLQMSKFQKYDSIDKSYKRIVEGVAGNYEQGCQYKLQSKMEACDEDESDTSSYSSKDDDILSLSNPSIHSYECDFEEEKEKENITDGTNEFISTTVTPLQYPSKDIIFGMNTLLDTNHLKMMNIPASTIRRSMTLPIGMKI